MSVLGYVLAGLAAVAGGAVNALAGGGTLITFPMLTAVGVPPIAANITNTVALSPGYLGATFAQLKDLRGQTRRLMLLLPVGVLGGVAGGYLLLKTDKRTFHLLVPFLILLAVGLLAFQDRFRSMVIGRTGSPGRTGTGEVLSVLAVIPAVIYGGYFGAGVSVIVLAVLGIAINDSLTRLNALKQAVSFCCNVAAAVYFVFSGEVVWMVAVIMAVGAITGGILGGRLAGRVKPAALRRTVIIIGIVVAAIYLVR